MNLVVNSAILALVTAVLSCGPGQDAALARSVRHPIELAQAAPGGRAAAADVEVSDAEVEQTIALWAKRMNMTPEQLIEVYRRSGKTVGELKQHVRATLAGQKRAKPPAE
jgi:Bacterial trigger factor protein (TF) C-terminus